MRIGLNALQVRAAKSGVGQYIDGLIDGLLRCLAPDDRLIVYATPLNAPNYARDDPRLVLRTWGLRARRGARLLHEWLFLPRQLARDQLDIFHGPANFLPRRCPCPAVVTIHDASRWVDPARYTRANLLYSRWMTAHTLRLHTPVITVSQAARTDLVNYLHISTERIHVIHEAAHPRFTPHPAPLPEGALPFAAGEPYLLHVGTLEPGKNIATLVKAFARFRRTAREPWHLVLAGDRGWLMEELFQTIQAEGLGEQVHYLGYMPDEYLPALYAGAQCFVFPSLNEGFGLPPLEAMQCGTPVIASNRSSLPEVLGEAPLYVDPLDVEALAGALGQLAEDETLRRAMAERGLRQAAKYSWEETARQTLAVYRLAMGSLR